MIGVTYCTLLELNMSNIDKQLHNNIYVQEQIKLSGNDLNLQHGLQSRLPDLIPFAPQSPLL
jgi:hypothetical protein